MTTTTTARIDDIECLLAHPGHIVLEADALLRTITTAWENDHA